MYMNSNKRQMSYLTFKNKKNEHFKEKCTASAQRADLLKNLGDRHILEELKCMAVVGKTVIGP